MRLAGRSHPCPCLHEFLSIATHPRIYDPPAPLALAFDQIDAWLEAPSLVLLAETESHWPEPRTLVESAHVAGPQVHDARIAALCRQTWRPRTVLGGSRFRSVPWAPRQQPTRDRVGTIGPAGLGLAVLALPHLVGAPHGKYGAPLGPADLARGFVCAATWTQGSSGCSSAALSARTFQRRACI